MVSQAFLAASFVQGNLIPQGELKVQLLQFFIAGFDQSKEI